MGAATALVVASIATAEAAGTFERWIGSPAGWVSNDAEAANLAKRVERFRAILPSHAEPVESGSAGSELWIQLRCRARDPAEAPRAWIDLPDHPAQPPAPHWASDPIGFVLTLVRHGEIEATPVEMRAGRAVSQARIIRRRVTAWTGSDRRWLSIEFAEPARTAATLLDMIAGGGSATIVLSGPRVRMEPHPDWSAIDRSLARDMKRHCPRG